MSPSLTVLRNRYRVFISVACQTYISICTHRSASIRVNQHQTDSACNLADIYSQYSHLWRKREDADLIVKVGVLEVRLHVGDPQPSLCCKHHTISRLGSLRFRCCCEGTFGTFLTSETCSSSRQNWTSKGNNVKFMLHVTVGCWVLSSC